jgi:transposase
LIKDLFELENLRDTYSAKGFLKQRKNRAEQIFEKLKQKLERLYPQVPSGLSFGKAIAYTLDNWEQLISYVDYFELTPSNNAAERAIRPFVIGRKNWLFSGSPVGAKSSAILYSLVESAKLQGHKPFEYLHFIFRQIPYCQNDEDYAALLPFNITSEQLQVAR